MRLRFLILLCSSFTWSAASPAACLKDVRASFRNIRKEVTPLYLWTNDVFDRGSYRQIMKTRFGLDNHIQGIVRVPGTSTFILSGGDRYIKEANLFIVNIGTGYETGLLLKNFHVENASDTMTDDGFLSKLDIGSREYWHAGGLAVVDQILAVPTENPKNKTSKIAFYDLADPSHPVKLPTEIIRPTSTTGTVLFSRTNEGKYVVGGSVNGTMEFFESITTDLRDGFNVESKVIQTGARGQGTDLISQCDGKTFIIDFNNTSSLAPILYGKNFVSLFEVDLQSGKSALVSKHVLDTNRTCNFKAAGSHHVSEDGKLFLYGSSFYRHLNGKQFKMCQFSE